MTLSAVQDVHTRALTELLPYQQKELKQTFRGIVLGHTHLPLIQQAPELPYLLDCGDFRDSATFFIMVDDSFRLMKWSKTNGTWLEQARLQF